MDYEKQQKIKELKEHDARTHALCFLTMVAISLFMLYALTMELSYPIDSAIARSLIYDKYNAPECIDEKYDCGVADVFCVIDFYVNNEKDLDKCLLENKLWR